MKTNTILKVIAQVALFIGSSSLNFDNILPEQVHYSAPVLWVLMIYRFLGAVSFGYLALILIKNKKLWLIYKENDSSQSKYLNWKNIKPLPFIFLSYYLFHLYMIFMENLNNTHFVIGYRSLNLGLLVEQYFPLVLIILFVLRLVLDLPEGKIPSKLLNVTAELKKEHFYWAVLTALAFTDHLVARLVWNIIFAPVDSTAPLRLIYTDMNILGRQDFIQLLVNLVLIFIVIGTLSYFIVKGIQALTINNINFSVALTSSFLLALVFNFLIQASMRVNEGRMYYGYVVTGINLFQILILMLLFMSIYMVVNRYMIATAIIIFIFGGFSLGNAIKFSVRQEPIYVSELAWLSNLQSLASFIDGKLLVVFSVALLSISFLAVLLSRKFFQGKMMTWKVRTMVLLGIILLFFPIMQNFRNLNEPKQQINFPILSQYIQRYNKSLLWRGSPKLARDKSLSYVWLKKIYGKTMEEPEGYSPSKLKEIVQHYSKEAEKINEKRSEDISDQTVIYILSESLANPNRIIGANLSENPLKNIDKIKAEATGGLMYSNGFAGGTANMEAQSLSGLPMVNYSSNISTINSDVFPSMPFIPSISNQFYEKIALHPENAANYNRNTIYKKLGFDHFYALSNTEKEDILTNQETLDGFVTNAQVYQEVLAKIDPERSQFFSVLTMQNHMSYEKYSGASTIKATGDGYDEEQNKFLQNYVRKISDTDKETQNFLEKLQKINKKITVVFYGDHLSNVFLTHYPSLKAEPLKAYQTDYFIWSNTGNMHNKQEEINAAEFAPALLETTGAKVSPYYALLSKVMWELPSEYNSALAPQLTFNNTLQRYKEDLEIIQYDLTAGKHYLKESDPFFQLSE